MGLGLGFGFGLGVEPQVTCDERDAVGRGELAIGADHARRPPGWGWDKGWG